MREPQESQLAETSCATLCSNTGALLALISCSLTLDLATADQVPQGDALPDEVRERLQQMGVDHCYTWLLPEQVTVHFIQALKQVRDSWPRVSTRPASTAIPIAAC